MLSKLQDEINTLSPQEAQLRIDALRKQPLSMSEKKQLIILRKQVDNRRKDADQEKALEELKECVGTLNGVLMQVHNVHHGNERLDLFMGAGKTVERTEVLITQCGGSDDPITRKLVNDCQKLLDGFIEEQHRSFISVKRSTQIMVSQSSKHSNVPELKSQSFGQRMKTAFNRLMNCSLCHSEQDMSLYASQIKQ